MARLLQAANGVIPTSAAHILAAALDRERDALAAYLAQPCCFNRDALDAAQRDADAAWAHACGTVPAEPRSVTVTLTRYGVTEDRYA